MTSVPAPDESAPAPSGARAQGRPPDRRLRAALVALALGLAAALAWWQLRPAPLPERQGTGPTCRPARHASLVCADCHADHGRADGEPTFGRAAGREAVAASDQAEAERAAIVDANCRRCHPGASRLAERHGLRIDHEAHLRRGTRCVACHGGTIGGRGHAPGQALPAQHAVDGDACHACHDGKRRIGDQVAFDSQDPAHCTRCHVDAAPALAHGARAVGGAGRPTDCLSCHAEAHPDHFPLGTETAQGRSCAQCHAKVTGAASVHPPYARDLCVSCHRVMSPTYLFGTGPEPDAALCLACHADTVPAEGPESAPLEGASDVHTLHRAALSAARRDWCLSCHDPHASDAPRAQLRLRDLDGRPAGRFEALPTGGRCSEGCHADAPVTYAGLPRPDRSPWP